MQNGPDLWTAILEQMLPGAVIAGGAIRDFILGVEPKDIDVFYGEVPLPEVTDIDFSEIHYFDLRCGLHRIDAVYERIEEYKAMTGINLVSTGEMFGYKVDAVLMDDFKGGFDLVEGFDFGINRCWWNGQINDTDEAAYDRENKVVTLLQHDRLERSQVRFDRFNARMGGGWTYCA